MKKNNVIIYVLVALFFFSFVFFIVSFAYSSIENISVMNFKSRMDDYAKKEKEFINLEKNYKEWKKIDKIFVRFKKNYFIKFDKYPDFRNELQSILASTGLQLLDLNHKYRNLMDDINKVEIGMQLKGSYMNLKKFIYEIENKDKMVLFKDIQFFKKDTININAKIALEVYFVR